MTQREALALHSKACRPEFNPLLFKRTEEEIIDEMKNVILSICNRGTYYNIEVIEFQVITDYEEIMKILYQHGEQFKNRNKDKTRENKYAYIEIKDSSYDLLMVTYRLTCKDETEVITVPIAIPRIVDKYYFNILGNLYLPQLQVVDASTYNNALSSSKTQSVVLKTLSQPLRMYRRTARLTSKEGEVLEAVYFDLSVFKKTARAFKYILAEYGFYGAFQFLGLEGIFVSNTLPKHDPNYYVFYNKENTRARKLSAKVDLYVQVSKYLFDNDVVTQNMVVTLIDSTLWLERYDDLFGFDFWKAALGADFHSNTVEKGEGLLTSFRSLLDISTKRSLHLPPEVKDNIFSMVKWMVYEFSALRAKDNLNILTKKIRVAEYIAALYATKLNNGIYRITDIGKKVTIDNLKKALMTDPMCLLQLIPKCSLVAFKNIVTDVDATEVLKFSVKGQSGLGDNSSNSIPTIYRHIHESYPGIVDPTHASATDPGVTGIINPTAKLYDGGFFSRFEEPNEWPELYAQMLEEYHRITGLTESIKIRKILGESEDDAVYQATIDSKCLCKSLLNKVVELLEQNSTTGRICPFINIEDGSVDFEVKSEEE